MYVIKHLTPHLPLQLRASISISNRSYPSKTNQNEPNLKQIKSDKYLFAIIIVEFMNYICSHFVSISFDYISTDLHFLPENCLRFIIKLWLGSRLSGKFPCQYGNISFYLFRSEKRQKFKQKSQTENQQFPTHFLRQTKDILIISFSSFNFLPCSIDKCDFMSGWWAPV